MQSRMYKQLFYSVVVILVVGLLVTFISWPSKSMALGKTQYKAVQCNMQTSQMQKILDQYSGQGWELVAVEATMGNLIFKK